uniref:Uncharacterized protein n=1 Tax=Glossina palpalis gambiensis TaxID=67801 RepID=A0A1B0C549_9MUSC
MIKRDERKSIFKLELGNQGFAYGQVSRQCTDNCLTKGLDELANGNEGPINGLIEEHERFLRPLRTAKAWDL